MTLNSPPNSPPFVTNPRFVKYKYDLAVVKENFVPEPTEQQLRDRHLEDLRYRYSSVYPDAYKVVIGADSSYDAMASSDYWLGGAANNPFAEAPDDEEEARDHAVWNLPDVSITETLRRFHVDELARMKDEEEEFGFFDADEDYLSHYSSSSSDDADRRRFIRSAAPSPDAATTFPTPKVTNYRFELIVPPNTPVGSPPKRDSILGIPFPKKAARVLGLHEDHPYAPPPPPANTPANSPPKQSYLPVRLVGEQGVLEYDGTFPAPDCPPPLSRYPSGGSYAEDMKRANRGVHGHTHEEAVAEGRPPWTVSGMWVPGLGKVKETGLEEAVKELAVSVESVQEEKEKENVEGERKEKVEKVKKRGTLRKIFRNSKGR